MSNEVKYAFRIVHISNMADIAQYGIEHANSSHSIEYTSIGDESIIEKRRHNINSNGIVLGDYIPFYFGPRSPMLYEIQHGFNNVKQRAADEIVYVVVSIQAIINANIDCIFTDGHAFSRITKFYDKVYLPKLNEIVFYNDVYAKYWKSEDDLDLKRRKEAELLIKNNLPFQYIAGFVVYDDAAKDKLIDCGIDSSRISVKPNFYF